MASLSSIFSHSSLFFVQPVISEMQFVMRTIVVYRDIWDSTSDLRLLTCHLGGKILKKNSIVNTRCFHGNDLSRHWVLRLLDLALECSKSVFKHPLLVALRWCVPGIHHQCNRVRNVRWGQQLATLSGTAGCCLTIVVHPVEVVRALRAAHIELGLQSFRRNTFDLLPLKKSMVQRSAGKHDQWRGYMTVLVVNHGIIKSISILTVVFHPMTKFDVNKCWDWFRDDLQWTLAIH